MLFNVHSESMILIAFPDDALYEFFEARMKFLNMKWIKQDNEGYIQNYSISMHREKERKKYYYYFFFHWVFFSSYLYSPSAKIVHEYAILNNKKDDFLKRKKGLEKKTWINILYLHLRVTSTFLSLGFIIYTIVIPKTPVSTAKD